MEDLRMALLKDTSPKNIKVLIKKFKKHVIYDELCDFCDMCEILHIEIADSVRKFVVEFILEFRRENLRPYDEEIELDIPGREQLMIDILEENLDAFDDLLDDEKIHLLLFLARIMKVMCFNDRRGVPWAEMRFLMCLYVATKSDKHHVKYPLIDCMFQFLIDEELIVNNLRNLLEMLKNGSNNDKWLKDLRSIYRKTRYYYEMQKIYFHSGYISDLNDYWQNELTLIRHFQQIAESLKVIEKLGINKIKNNIQPLFSMFSIPTMIKSFIGMRNPLSHAKINRGDIAKDRFGLVLLTAFMKLDFVIFDLIREEKIEILDIFINKLMTETDSKKLLSKFNVIDTNRINNWAYESTENAKIKWFSDFMKNQINSVEKYIDYQSFIELGKSFDGFQKLDLGQFNNETLSFFSSLQGLGVEEIKERLQYFRNSNNQIIRISQTLLLLNEISKIRELVLEPTPINAETVALETSLYNFYVDQTKFIEKLANKNNDYKIEKVLNIIINVIGNLEVKSKFEGFCENLAQKRHLYNDYKLFEDANYIRDRWPQNDETISWNTIKATYKDPLESIVTKTKENRPDFEAVEQFLDKIDFENKTEIVENAKHLERIKLKNRLLTIKRELGDNEDDHFAKEMAVLDGFEISRLMGRDLPMEPNYMDYHCLLPTGRPLRNFLAHGDIYLDLFLTQAEKQTILDQQLEEIIDQMEEEGDLNSPVSKKEDVSYLKKRFNRQKSWIEMYIAPLKLSIEDRFLSGNISAKENFVVAMKTRNVHELTYVHHSLEKCDRNNKFFMYLTRQLALRGENRNEIFDKMIEDSKCPKTFDLKESTKLESICCTFRDYVISDYINEENVGKKEYNLCIILCFDCQDIEVFEQVLHRAVEHSCGFLNLACFYKQLEIVKYLIDNQHVTDKSELGEGLLFAASNNNVQSAKYLLDKCVSLDKTQAMKHALFRSNFEMIKLLVEHGAELDFSLVRERTFNVFSLPSICEYLVEHYPDLINYRNSILIFRACICKSEDMVRFLIEKGTNVNAKFDGIAVLTNVSLIFDDLRLVEYLVEKGANTEFDTNPNPLTAACFNGNVKIAKYLLDKGLNPSLDCKLASNMPYIYDFIADFTRRFGSGSPLNYSIESQSFALTEVLFERNVKINKYTVGKYIAKIKPHFFKYLISRDSNISWVINSLRFVIANENIELLKEMLIFLQLGKHHLTRNDIGLSFFSRQIFYLLMEYPYHEISEPDWAMLLKEASFNLVVEEMKVLISKGANINYKYRYDNSTLLHAFFEYEFFDSTKLRLILRSGAELTAKNNDQFTPIQIAAQKLDENTFQQVLKIVLETRKVCVTLKKKNNNFCNIF